MEIDPIFRSRIQFAFVVTLQIIFPALVAILDQWLLYQPARIDTHFTALSGPLARSGGCRGVGHHKAFATQPSRPESAASGGAERSAGGPK